MTRRLRARWPRVLRLEPGDVVLLECDDLTPDKAKTVKAQWERRLPDVPVVVLGGIRAKVLRHDDERTT